MKRFKIGICVVYYYGKNLEWLLNMHLQGITENTKDADYVIYAAVNRLSEEYLAILEQMDKVEIVELPLQKITGAVEHGRYLDGLMRHAVSNGCSHVCTLDSDSWPICNNWVTTVIDRMNLEKTSILSVLRTELGDCWLPHPCGMFMSKEFIEDYKPRMWDFKDKEKFDTFIRETKQRQDTGIAIGQIIWENNLGWTILERTNTHNDHFLMAGIYGELFFHLGATSRLKIFHKEFNDTFARRVRRILNKLPMIWKYSERIEKWLINSFPPRVHYKNEYAYKKIISRLIKDSSLYYNYLGSMEQNIEKK